MFKQEFEWLTSNTRVAYPFVERVIDPTGSTGSPFADLVVDACVSYPASQEQDIRLSLLSDPRAAAVSVEFRYADSTVAFSSMGADFKKSSMGSWTLLEWTKSSGAARLLLLSASIDEFTWPVVPADAYLVGHALQPIQSFVQSLTAELQTFDGTVELVAGYNVSLSIQQALLALSSARQITDVLVSVSAGAGLGRYPDCSFDDPPIFTINGIGPDEQGNFLLDPKDCYRGQIPVTNPFEGAPWRFLPNAYKLFNDCSPCCECEDYVYVYDELLRRVCNQATAVAAKFYAVRDRYQGLYDMIQEQKACREQPRVELKLIGRHGWSVAVQVVVYNNGGCLSDDISLSITLAGPAGQTIPDAQRMDTDDMKHKPFLLGGTWPTYTIQFTDGVRGARSLVASFELYFPIGSRVPGAAITGTVTGTVDGVAVTDTASTTLTQVFNKS